MDNRGLAPRAPAVQQMANLLLVKRLDSSEEKLTVGKLWVKRFVQRQEALQSKYNRKYDYQRAKCEDLALIGDWFRLV
jgi:Tc5 transposase DNA-binding domain